VFARDYRIVEPLAEGGMGMVYVAEQISTGMKRALKLMQPKLVADTKWRQRFEQEARVGSRIESEQIVAVVGAGVDEVTEAPWLAMELLKGETLAALLERGPLAQPLVLETAEEIFHAVGAAHAAGVVHRDLKPENVFIAETRRPGKKTTVKVLDFGIAKIFVEAKTTQTAAVGSPMWMAPEQTARGGKIAPQTDVWSLGLIVFTMVTGRHFWRSAEEEGAGVGPLLREIAMDPMPTASERAKELGLADALPVGFDAWLERSLDRVIDHRFGDANAQMKALRDLLSPKAEAANALAVAATVRVGDDDDDKPGAHEKAADQTPTTATTTTPETSTAAPLKGRSPIAVAGGVAAVVLLGVVGAGSYRAGQLSHPDTAVEPSANAPVASVVAPSPATPMNDAGADAGGADAGGTGVDAGAAVAVPRRPAGPSDATRAKNALAAGDPVAAKGILYTKLGNDKRSDATDEEVRLLLTACEQTDDQKCVDRCKKRLGL
jgi:serine/threonine-protein kinase